MTTTSALLRISTIGFAFGIGAAAPAAAQSLYAGGHPHMVVPEQLTWTDAPAVAPGAKIAVIEGPLNQAVPFTFRLRIPENSKISTHVHPAYERVTVLSGTFYFAHGDQYDRAKTSALGPGSVAIMPPNTPMFGYTKEDTVIQLHGVGPWGLTYLNPADDPRRK
ncbi:MAG TPA: cupin domain-containing protein [Burkholderiales bacterium]